MAGNDPSSIPAGSKMLGTPSDIEPENIVLLVVFVLLVALVYVSGLIVWVWCNRTGNPDAFRWSSPTPDAYGTGVGAGAGEKGSCHRSVVLMMVTTLKNNRQTCCHHQQSLQQQQVNTLVNTKRIMALLVKLVKSIKF